jgi:ribonuclease HI
MMYTVEQIMQAISTLGAVEKKQLWRKLSESEGQEVALGQAKQMALPTTPMLDGTRQEGAFQADYILHFDGGSRGNPGQGYGSYALLQGHNGPRQPQRLQFGDMVTSNEAEYDTLIAALERLLEELRERGEEPTQKALEVRGDSRLVLQQIQGLWKAKDERMRERRDRALRLLRRFGRFQLKEVPRSESVAVLGH